MSADNASKFRIISRLAESNISFIFGKTIARLVRPVAASDLIAQHGAAADGGNAFFKCGKAAVDCIWRGVMVDQRRRAATQSGQSADLTADFHALERVGAIQPPPNELQYLVKVPRLPRRRGHPGRQSGIQMRVAVHQPGHQYGTVAFDDLIAGCSNNILPDASNLTGGYAEVASLDPCWIKLHE